jgi:hypothetical protein
MTKFSLANLDNERRWVAWRLVWGKKKNNPPDWALGQGAD